MAMPNPDVWGSWSDWHDARIISATGSGNWDIYACKPKIRQFSTSSPVWSQYSLGRGIEVGKITANQQIDLSICICGQHPMISPFAHIGIFSNHQNAADNKVPDTVYQANEQINWFFADVDAATGFFRDHVINTSSPVQKWAPDATNAGSANHNYYVTPYVYYQFKSIFLQIYVETIDSYDSNNVPVTTWRHAREWMTTYRDRKICGVRIALCAYESYSNNIIYYRANPSPSASDTCSAVCVVNEVSDIIDYATYLNERSQTVDLIHHHQNNYSNTQQLFYCTGYGLFDDQEYKSAYYVNTESGWNVWTEIPYSTANYEKILSMAALFGCPFTDSDKYSFNIDFLDNDMFLPVIPENGIAEGEYTRGADNLDNSLYGISTVRNINYDPSTPITPYDPNTYSLVTGFNSLSGGASATQRYVLNDSNVRQLLTDLWTITHTIADVDYEKFDYKILDSFLVTDPINSIVSLKRYPFNIPHTFSPNKTHVNLGKNQGEALGYLSYNVFNSVQFAGVSIWPKFGKSFLDYSPYTEYELYIPFCGTVKLDPGEILDHVLSVRMEIDLISGVCISYILADSLVIETVTGSVAADMQVAGTDAATADAAIQNAVINHTTARTNKEVAMVTPYTPGGIMGELSNPSKQAGAIANAKTNLEKANYDITHINTPVHTMGTAGGLSSWIQEFNCRLMIYYPEGDAIDSSGGVSDTSPKLADLTEYGHTTGFYCVMQGTVSDFTGYTLGNIDTSSIAGATAEEREQIKAAFSSGVWL